MMEWLTGDNRLSGGHARYARPGDYTFVQCQQAILNSSRPALRKTYDDVSANPTRPVQRGGWETCSPGRAMACTHWPDWLACGTSAGSPPCLGPVRACAPLSVLSERLAPIRLWNRIPLPIVLHASCRRTGLAVRAAILLPHTRPEACFAEPETRHERASPHITSAGVRAFQALLPPFFPGGVAHAGSLVRAPSGLHQGHRRQLRGWLHHRPGRSPPQQHSPQPQAGPLSSQACPCI